MYVCALKMVCELYLGKAVVIQKAKGSRLQHLLQVSPWPGHGGKGKQGCHIWGCRERTQEQGTECSPNHPLTSRLRLDGGEHHGAP